MPYEKKSDFAIIVRSIYFNHHDFISQTNVPLGTVTIKKADLSELPKCDCKADQEHPCGRDSECLNAMMMYQCHPALCPAGEKCENQFFTKRQYPAQQNYRTEKRGWGLKAMEDIKKVN